MASFAEGIVKGLQQQQELNLRKAEQRRQQAISMSQLAATEEERQYKREQRARQEKALGEIQKHMEDTFGYDSEEPVPAAMQGGAPAAPGQPAQMQRVRKYHDIYDNSPEGRERQLRYHSGYTRILMNNGLMSPADMKASAEYATYLDKSGVSDAALNLFMTDGRDQRSLNFLAKKLNLDPNSIKITGSLVDNTAKIEAAGVNGQTFSRPLGDLFSALGINAFKEIQEARQRERLVSAQIKGEESKSDYYRASAADKRASAVARGTPKPLKPNELPKIFFSQSSGSGGPTEMPLGRPMVAQLSSAAMSADGVKLTPAQAAEFAAETINGTRNLPSYKQDLYKFAKDRGIVYGIPVKDKETDKETGQIRITNVDRYNEAEQAFLNELMNKTVSAPEFEADVLNFAISKGYARQRSSAISQDDEGI